LAMPLAAPFAHHTHPREEKSSSHAAGRNASKVNVENNEFAHVAGFFVCLGRTRTPNRAAR
jgi:hypothetical protein